MSKNENKYWIYSYQNTCGPCRRLTPIVDTILATNSAPLLKKVKFEDAPDLIKRYGTPAIALWDEKEQKIISKVFTGNFWSGYMDLYDNHDYLLSTEYSPIQFLVKIIQSAKDPTDFFKK